MLQHPALKQIAERHAVSTAQIALAWTVRQKDVVAIPKAARLEHVSLNAAAAELQLSEGDLALLDKAFPPPMRKHTLEVV